METRMITQASFIISLPVPLSSYRSFILWFLSIHELKFRLSVDHRLYIRLVPHSFSGYDFIFVSQAIATAMKQGSNQGLRFMWFNEYKKRVTNDGEIYLSPLMGLFGGMSAGCFSTLGNNPFDVVKASSSAEHLFSLFLEKHDESKNLCKGVLNLRLLCLICFVLPSSRSCLEQIIISEYLFKI